MLRDENGKPSTSRMIGLVLGFTMSALALVYAFGGPETPEYVYKTMSGVLIALAVQWGARTTMSNSRDAGGPAK